MGEPAPQQPVVCSDSAQVHSSTIVCDLMKWSLTDSQQTDG